MKNFVSDGEAVDVIAPYDLKPGEGVLIGSLFGVAASAAVSGQSVPIYTKRVYSLDKKPSQAWSIGDKIYWDATNKHCTKTASGNTLIGVAVSDVAGGAADVTGHVRLGIVA